jgi:type III secretion protein R
VNSLATFSPASALLTVLVIALAPFVAVMVTSFTKIVVTINLLRSALGLQQTPPAIVVNGLALILTLFVMYPVGLQARGGVEAMQRLEPAGAPAVIAYADAAKEPLREFLLKHTAARERAFFLDNARRAARPATPPDLSERDFVVVVPAFTVSELTAAFQIGFLLFLPFLVIDLVVANVLLSMGMMMLPPTTVSLPFKLLLFVMLDGWARLAHGLVLSYQ